MSFCGTVCVRELGGLETERFEVGYLEGRRRCLRSNLEIFKSAKLKGGGGFWINN